MKKPIVCIDLDDTIADTYSTIVKLAKKYDIEALGGMGILDKSIDSKDYYYFARMLGWNNENVTTFFQKYYPSYLKKIAPNKEAKRVLKKIKKINLSIYIVTARKQSSKEDVLCITKNWLDEKGIIYDNLIINVMSKAKIVKEVDGKYFLDDSIENCKAVKMACPKTHVFLLNTSYNSNLNINGIKRVYNLEEFYKEIRRIEYGEEYNY